MCFSIIALNSSVRECSLQKCHRFRYRLHPELKPPKVFQPRELPGQVPSRQRPVEEAQLYSRQLRSPPRASRSRVHASHCGSPDRRLAPSRKFVVMPAHFHVLLTVDCGMTIERAVQFYERGICLSCRKGTRSECPVLAERVFGNPHSGRGRVSASCALHSQQCRGSALRGGSSGVSAFIRACWI